MKVRPLLVAITADQRHSRTSPDGVPAALDALAGLPTRLPFERAAGDEIQALLDEPAAVVDAVIALTRLGDWRIGLGVGSVETPLPTSTRAARGPAYLAARTAVEQARRAPTGLALVVDPDEAPETVGTLPYRDCLAEDVEAALWMLRSVLQRRSEEGWELVDLLADGHTNQSAAGVLGISPSAVSQRLARSHRTEIDRGAALATRLLTRLLSGSVA